MGRDSGVRVACTPAPSPTRCPAVVLGPEVAGERCFAMLWPWWDWKAAGMSHISHGTWGSVDESTKLWDMEQWKHALKSWTWSNGDVRRSQAMGHGAVGTSSLNLRISGNTDITLKPWDVLQQECLHQDMGCEIMGMSHQVMASGAAGVSPLIHGTWRGRNVPSIPREIRQWGQPSEPWGSGDVPCSCGAAGCSPLPWGCAWR